MKRKVSRTLPVCIVFAAMTTVSLHHEAEFFAWVFAAATIWVGMNAAGG